MDIGPLELILILVIVTMLFGVGKIPEVFAAVGKGVREFRQNLTDSTEPNGAGSVGRTTLTGGQHTAKLQMGAEAAPSQCVQS